MFRSTFSTNIAIKRVEQKDEAGCGIACVAMISGRTYRETKGFFEHEIFKAKDKKPHTRHYQLRQALERLGISSNKRIFRSWRSIDANAIVPINRDSNGGWHWVVFVAHRMRPYILDPAQGKTRRRYNFRGLKARGYYIVICSM